MTATATMARHSHLVRATQPARDAFACAFTDSEPEAAPVPVARLMVLSLCCIGLLAAGLLAYVL